MKLHVLIPAGLLLVMAAPAMAAPFCTDDRGGVSITFERGFGPQTSESDLNDMDLMELQRRGVDATRVERWNGCIRAYVRQANGAEEMEFYDPNTMQRVY